MSDGLIERLSRPFELWQHEYRKQGKGDDVTGYLTYVGIEHVIARFNEELGDRWSVTVLNYQVHGLEAAKEGQSARPSAIVHLRISFVGEDNREVHRDGLGAAQWQSSADDLDKIIKTAMADAFKKASHQFGMAGYLWDKGLADQIAVELLKDEGRPWAAKYRPKAPRAGNPASVILANVKASKGGAAKAAPAKADPQGETVERPAGPPTHDGDPVWQKAWQELNAFVKAADPKGGAGNWAKSIEALVDGRFHCKPRQVSGEDLAAYVAEIQASKQKAPAHA
jgi:hypothetical protein